MRKKDRVFHSLHREAVDQHPVFISSTPQFLRRILGIRSSVIPVEKIFKLHVKLDLDVIQVGHPSFYPVRVLELPKGSHYIDDWGRNHVITEYYDEFCPPFPLSPKETIDVELIRENFESYEFPDPSEQKWFLDLDEIVRENERLKDPPSVWGVINGPLEPAWQLISDGWVQFFILARKDFKLAGEIMGRVVDYCIEAGCGMIDHGVDVIRIGDDYALNDRLMCSPRLWEKLVYPAHRRLVAGLKRHGGQSFPIILHSDGNITEILSFLTKSGIDALNPIQPDALVFEDVIQSVGNELALTGAFDLRFFLEGCTPEVLDRIYKETKRLFDIVNEFNSQGNQAGFCIGPTHQIQPASDVNTFIAWIEIVKKLNRVPT
ncbi:MAG: uroporphyrinogen decarboxylase family protein [Promethearchaeota archaeon]